MSCITSRFPSNSECVLPDISGSNCSRKSNPFWSVPVAEWNLFYLGSSSLIEFLIPGFISWNKLCSFLVPIALRNVLSSSDGEWNVLLSGSVPGSSC
jgi:hypothetical protein